ncbi:hypothetical protein QVD17_41756 [Tagetes erecta]|uniref:Uncharacterized protein n=1 Tax=Tagetes erecta TaxID=13708 RepID=A0AAD8NF33_TARER|nr:hypothetical protein QVD17_41756 [Tagetes erecta]
MCKILGFVSIVIMNHLWFATSSSYRHALIYYGCFVCALLVRTNKELLEKHIVLKMTCLVSVLRVVTSIDPLLNLKPQKNVPT